MRRFVIGDIHGCAKALRTLIETIDPCSEDELVFLGDYKCWNCVIDVM